MPRFFFDIQNDDITRDDEGAEFSDPEAAVAYAIDSARTLAAATVRNGYLVGAHCIEVFDNKRKLIRRVRFDEAVALRL